MASKDKPKAKRISSRFFLNLSHNSKVEVRSFSDPPPAQSPVLSSPQLSDRSLSPPPSVTLAPPASIRGSRSPSPLRGRAQSPFSSESRRPWRSRSRAKLAQDSEEGPRFWIISGDGEKVSSYDVTALARSEKVLELWDDEGDALLYLFPRTSNKGPSFKLSSSLFSSSSTLASLAYGNQNNLSRRSSLDKATRNLSLEGPESSALNINGNEHQSDGSRSIPEMEISKQEFQLYFPISLKDDGQMAHPEGEPSSELIEELVSIRNLFAFLARQPLVASRRYPTVFSVFTKIADFLQDLKFSNLDSSTFGEVPLSSFQFYTDRYKLGDVRHSREKSIEGLVLGERMKSFELYNEAFVHGVGKYEALKKLGSPHFDEISKTTRNRMERSFMDLQRRIKSVRGRLTEFEFPSLFAGIANSTTSDESKTVHFKTWKASFNVFRKHIINYYKQQLGSWPPKASYKRPDFEESGLNRIVLRILYNDMTDLYDLLVDRTALTSRSADLPRLEGKSNPSENSEGPNPEALRRIMSEYDRSSPPVQPAIPFDIPRLPSQPPPLPASTTTNQKSFNNPSRKLLPPEIDLLLNASYNTDAHKSTSFMTAYRHFERKTAYHKTLREIQDQRNGYWIFLYAVLQSLPLLVIDAPGLKYTEGVEYFLCEPPKGGFPWSKDDSSRRKSWYGIPGGQSMVSLPHDVVDHGVEGIYRRSHCWVVAERWMNANALNPAATGNESPISGPTMTGQDTTSSTREFSSSPPHLASAPSENRQNRLSTISLGLEALPIPPDLVDQESGRQIDTTSEPNRKLKFEDIIPEPRKAGKKRWIGSMG